jgi:hypothetical protein
VLWFTYFLSRSSVLWFTYFLSIPLSFLSLYLLLICFLFTPFLFHDFLPFQHSSSLHFSPSCSFIFTASPPHLLHASDLYCPPFSPLLLFFIPLFSFPSSYILSFFCRFSVPSFPLFPLIHLLPLSSFLFYC